MEKRLVVAVFLMALAILVTQTLFPPPVVEEENAERAIAGAGEHQQDEEDEASPFDGFAPADEDPEAAADTVWVETDLYRYGISSLGGALVRAEVLNHRSFVRDGEPVQLVAPEGPGVARHRLVIGRDTVDLRNVPFVVETIEQPDGGAEVRMRSEGRNGALVLNYRFRPDNYVIDVEGRVEGVGNVGVTLLTDLGPGLEPHDANLSRTVEETALVTRGAGGGLATTRLDRLDGRQAVDGPLAWAGVKDRYFLIAIVAPGTGLGEVIAAERPPAVVNPPGEEPLQVPRADVTATLPVGPSGEFAYRLYLGPQEHGKLAAAGGDLQQVSRYGYRWLQPVIRPIAAVILWFLDYAHDTLGVGYGWVLILFGVMMRVVLWPLHAKGMRAQLKNMAVQPLFQEIREKYKDDQKRQQEEIMKLYKEEGFNPFAGCLPMLVPFPVLITLFFVFEGTIAFRGESFLWLPDLSLRDPLFILPVFLVISMFSLQVISQKISQMEMTGQMKFMMYGMPLAIGFIFFMLPSGLNLYYATTNVATIPQQVYIAKERRKAQEAAKKKRPARKGGAEKAPVGAGMTRAERRRKQRKS